MAKTLHKKLRPGEVLVIQEQGSAAVEIAVKKTSSLVVSMAAGANWSLRGERRCANPPPNCRRAANPPERS